MMTGIDPHYTGWYSGPNEILFFDNVLHVYCGNLWNGGMGGSSGYTKNIIIPNSAHELFTTPNILPSSWTIPTVNGGSQPTNYDLWYSPNGVRPNGVSLGYSMAGSTTYHTIVVSDVGGGVGRTVAVMQPMEYNWDVTNRGDILTPFVQNIATWFGGGGGIPAEVRIEPQSLNLDSNGNYISFKVEGFPENPEYTPMDVDGTSVMVGGVGADLKYGTWNNNKYIGKADRLLVEDSIGYPGDEMEVDISGQLQDGTGFFGTAVIKAV
jgi:hypothetical protein